MDFDWDNLKVVLAIARTGSLTAAASHLDLDQSTVGRRLSAMEQTTGARLFRRSKTGFLITEAGEVALAAAKAVEMRLDAMAQKFVPDAAANAGVVRVLGNGWMLSELARHALPRLMQGHPELEVRFVSRLPPVPIYSEPTVALWFDATPRAPDRAKPIVRVPYAVYQSRIVAPAKNDWVIFRDDDAQGPSFARVVKRTLGANARVRMTGTDASHLAAAIGAGLGQGYLPVCIGDRDETLVRTDPDQRPIERLLHAHFSPEFEGRARQQTVMDWLHASLCDTVMGHLP
ncbi:MAG: LysR family transcriptional regulator [Paracoccaceae bacterium]